MKRTIFILTALVLSIYCFGQGEDAPNKIDANGKRQGKWARKDVAGKLVYEGQFKDGIPYGPFNYYYETGQKKMVTTFSDNGKTARSQMFFTSGKLMAEGKYSGENIKDSVWKYYNEDQKLLKIECYLKGKKDGNWKVYADDGSLARDENWKNGVQDGPVKEWYEKDKLKMEGTYLKGVLEGKVAYYYPDGLVSASGTYKNGKKDGGWKYMMPGGKSGSQELYKNGVMVKSQRDNGEFEDHYPKNNILKAVTTYKGGKKNGPFVEYYEVGEWKKEVVPAHDDFPEEVKEYFDGQKMKCKGNYKDDKYEGKITFYKLNGEIEKTETYKDGVLVKE